MRHRNTPDSHHRRSGAERFLQIVVGLDTTAEVHYQTSFLGDAAEYGVVDDMLGFRAIEVDDV